MTNENKKEFSRRVVMESADELVNMIQNHKVLHDEDIADKVIDFLKKKLGRKA
jgi:hypothetical protein